MFNSSPLHHVFTAEEEADLLKIFEDNLTRIEGIEDAIEGLNHPKFYSPIWNEHREKLEDARMKLLDANYKCQIMLMMVGLMAV